MQKSKEDLEARRQASRLSQEDRNKLNPQLSNEELKPKKIQKRVAHISQLSTNSQPKMDEMND